MYAQIVTNVAGIVSYPLDTIRKRLMMTGGKKFKTRKDELYDGTIDCIKKTYEKEGSSISGKALFKGCFSNILRSSGGALVLVFNNVSRDAIVRA